MTYPKPRAIAETNRIYYFGNQSIFCSKYVQVYLTHYRKKSLESEDEIVSAGKANPPLGTVYKVNLYSSWITKCRVRHTAKRKKKRETLKN